MRVVVIHGPNLNLTGERDPQIYGSKTLADIDRELRELAQESGAELETAQYSAEGDIVDALHRARRTADAIVLNPGAYAHYSHVIADAVAAIKTPVIEVHLSNTFAREPFRRVSVVSPVCRGVIVGFGAQSYLLALRAALASAEPPERKSP